MSMVRAAPQGALLSASVLAISLAGNAIGYAAETMDTDSSGLGMVTVTSGKIDRSLLETPASVAVLEARDLEGRAGLSTTRDVLENLANITVVGTGNQVPTVRGVDGTGAAKGADAFFAGSRPRLNVQIDGRPASYNEITFGDFSIWDLERIEVLRGAHSTLQGRNAIAGTVITKTADPTYEPEGALRVAAGNFEQRRYSGMVSGPIVDDSVAYRLTADYLTRHTFVRDMTGFTGVADPGEFEALNVRGKLLFEPAAVEGLRTLLTLNHSDYKGPQTELVYRPFNELRTRFVGEPVFEPKTTSLIADTRYEIDPRLTFEGILSVTDLSVKRKAEVGSGIVNLDGDEYVFEPRLQFQGEGRQAAVAGLYFFRAEQDESIDFPSPQAFDDRITTAALFAEGTFPLSDTLDLIAGARYEQEKHVRRGGDQALVVIDLDETYRAFLPKIGLAWHVQDDATVGVVVARGYNGGGAGFTFNEQTAVFTNYQYDPEYVTSVELFGRKQLADGRVFLTANVFYSRYRDMQLSFDLTPADPTDYSFVVRNAEEAESYGAELGATWVLPNGLQVYGNLGLLDAQITRYPGSGFQGNDQPFAPSISAAGGISWRSERGWDAAFNARYSGSYYSDLANNARGKVGPYWVANAQLGYTVGNVRFYGSVENLFDSDEPLTIYAGSVFDEDTAEILTPRSYWAGVQISF